MDREKQIEEKHELSESIYMSGHGLDWKDSDDIAEQLYNAGYRKQSEIAREIFKSLETISGRKGGLIVYADEYIEFKKKYTEE